MKKIKLYTYIKLVVFLLLMFIAVKFPSNIFDTIIADLIEIKVLATTAKIISSVFNDK